MLSPDSRIVAFDQLRPPAGYELDFALLTTYTLDLEALLALPLSLVARSDNGLEELLSDPLLLIEALRRARERIHVFVDRAGIAIPRTRRELYALLEPSVHPVRAPGGGAFHPKVWVLRFMSGNGAPLIRIAVLSRNLTFDRSWDIALATESSPRPKKQCAGSHSLAEFVHRLPELCAEPPNPTVRNKIRALAKEVSRTRFPAPEGFFDDPVEFHVYGMNKRRVPGKPSQLTSNGVDILAVAPFIGRTALDTVARMGTGEKILVSTREQLDKLPDDALTGWSQIFTLSDATLDESKDEDDGRSHGLHAKFIGVEHGWNVTWFMGSANLTQSAISGRNVEVMAALSARKGRHDGNSGYGIQRFLKSGFEMLCEPYQPGKPEAESPEIEEALKRLETAREALLNADLKGVCFPSGENWTLRLEGFVDLPNTDVEIRVWPISLTEKQALPLQFPLTWTIPIQWLTRLVAFRLHVPVSGVDDIGMTMSLPVDGIPDDRMHHVLRSLIGDSERFMAFIRALLGGLDGMVEWARGSDASGGVTPWESVSGEEPLLEGLVRSASRDPGRLEPVRRLIKEFRKTDEGRRIVPDDFLALWNAVEDALHEDGRS